MDAIAYQLSSLDLVRNHVRITHSDLNPSTRSHTAVELSPEVAERQLAHVLATAASSDYQDLDSEGPRGITSEEFGMQLISRSPTIPIAICGCECMK
jgi:hypothetical protein